MQSNYYKNNFAYGELSPRAKGRFDQDKNIFRNGALTVENFISQQLGGLAYRPGTSYANEVKDSADETRLIPFSYSNQQNYAIEAGDYYFRFYADGALVTKAVTAVFDSYTKLVCNFTGTDEDLTYTADTGQTVYLLGGAKIDSAQSSPASSTSLYLDGTNDYVSIDDSPDWNFSSGDFTVEMYARFSNDTGYKTLFIQLYDDSNYQMFYFTDAGGDRLIYSINGTEQINKTVTINVNTWYHIALVKASGVYTIYVDGTSIGSNTPTAKAIPDYFAPLIIGATYTPGTGVSSLFSGWIDHVRISKGIARYTGNFTKPSTEWGVPDAWVTSTGYVIGNTVSNSGTNYYCQTVHTSGTFATDLAAGYWTTSAPVEVTTPYPKADVSELQFAQKDDVMYITHQSYAPRKLKRVSSTSFTLEEVNFLYPPLMDDNITKVQIQPSAATGSGITLTAYGSGVFNALHVGAYFKINTGIVKITAVASSVSATADVMVGTDGTAGTIGGTSMYTLWAEGEFSGYRGYPKSVCFHEGRLYYGGTTYHPQSFWGSVVEAYDTFETGSDNADALAFTFASNKVNNIQWIASSGNLIIGTINGTMSVSSGADATTITASNILVKYDTDYGVASIIPKNISSYLYYLQGSKYQLRELAYNFSVDRLITDDMTLLADHILREGNGAVAMARQMSPNDRLWIVRSDGQIAVLTRNVAQQVMGWCRLVAGDDSTTNGVFEDVCIVQRDNNDDLVYVIVKRKINGSFKRFVEYFNTEMFDDDWDSVNVDCSLTLDSPLTITGATKANPIVITSSSHGLSNGDYVKIDNVVGMTELNGNTYKVANQAANTFELTTTADVNVNGTAYTAYISGGEARKKVDTVSGLSHLEGEEVTCQCDSDTVETATVSSGAITLSAKYAVIHAGLPFDGTLKFTEVNDGGMKKNRRYTLTTLRLHRSLGGYIGQDPDNLTTLDLTANDNNYFTGDVEINPDTYWDKSGALTLKQTTSLPLFILSALFKSEVNDI